MRIDLVDLRLVLDIAEAASITHGANRSGLALASASERLRALEQTLSVSLFERQRRGVRPTPAGLALLHHARMVLQQLEAMRGELHGFATGIRGRVRLLSNTAATLEFLPPVLGPFLAAHPRIDVEVEEKPSPQIVRGIAQDDADIGIIADAVDPAAELETYPFAIDRLVLVVPSKHPSARRRHLAFRDILANDFVGLPSGSALQERIEEHAGRMGHRMRLRVRLPSFDAICRVVESGIGVAIVSHRAADRCRRSMDIRAVPLSDAWALRHLRLCVKAQSALSPMAQLLLTHLRAGIN
ncbi:DNA-binding transcriptional regulator, LysR family [Enhydrobacter aerosaccus]|uniref:DNA-binding transcriptional regulator, LysR family n=1 Tax=Enhydrobacter aerosaccus TaxID=225324 RepID=A0A1T4K3K9_9HYPH|nr:LysR substrate-binding domain-containing protein [Enhydrobacter aerosaccus]SJZ37022.1 DNA-binding transcriptional regulator, LysR family [Enhydrobacter aerosaccus]